MPDVAPVRKLLVHPGDGLDQVVTLDRFVDESSRREAWEMDSPKGWAAGPTEQARGSQHGVEEGHVKARQPHVHHDGDLEVGFDLLAVVLVAEQS